VAYGQRHKRAAVSLLTLSDAVRIYVGGTDNIKVIHMPDFALATLYVENPPVSAAFYTDLLEQAPVQASPEFVMFTLASGFSIGLWSRHNVKPAAAATGGGCELTFKTSDVDAVHADWARRGLTIAEPPYELPFGRTFVALDPDGHRLRVFTPAGS
jgi:predicted enzyme related to lactoylglutathione lyase